MSSNILRLPHPAKRRRYPQPDPVAALAVLSARVDEIGRMPFDSKADMQEAILLLGLSNAQVRQLIGHLRDEACRTRLLAHSDRIRELVELAGRKAADL
jgi:hypothetical protein